MVGYPQPSTRVAKAKKVGNDKCWQGYEGYEAEGALIYCRGECKVVQPVWKSVWQFVKKLSTELAYDPVIPLRGLYPREVEAHVHGKDCYQTFLAVFFVTAPNWKEPKYRLAVSGIMLPLISPVEQHPTVTRGKLLMHTAV